jgi:[ribosomal protein S5]-alanine N-acetyltransferase
MEARGLGLSTARLLLRPVIPEDLVALAQIWSDPEVMRHMGAGVRDAAASRMRHRELMEHQREHGFGKWAVIERASGDVIGYCGVELYEGGPDVELGFSFARAAWGKGYATEAAGRWLEHAFTALGCPRVIGLVRPDNAASIRVLEKLGMTHFGLTVIDGREWLLYETRSNAFSAISRSPL